MATYNLLTTATCDIMGFSLGRGQYAHHLHLGNNGSSVPHRRRAAVLSSGSSVARRRRAAACSVCRLPGRSCSAYERDLFG
ncbi:hypothetical protein E2562_032656 [Oryza meyeriana var. granulata]|uniref:Uncharacterized protein n=1 Tax=Oryza meyeriana var. granulata TaxID=110450 RepID=A0A6G1CKJ7_9ORYZ|nr:hypothetical protein E2562_032656 [Oryza meyeriana var. granulata]